MTDALIPPLQTWQIERQILLLVRNPAPQLVLQALRPPSEHWYWQQLREPWGHCLAGKGIHLARSAWQVALTQLKLVTGTYPALQFSLHIKVAVWVDGGLHPQFVWHGVYSDLSHRYCGQAVELQFLCRGAEKLPHGMSIAWTRSPPPVPPTLDTGHKLRATLPSCCDTPPQVDWKELQTLARVWT